MTSHLQVCVWGRDSVCGKLWEAFKQYCIYIVKYFFDQYMDNRLEGPRRAVWRPVQKFKK